MRSIIDFESYNSVGAALKAEDGKTPTVEEFLGMSRREAKRSSIPPRHEREAATEARLAEIQEKMAKRNAEMTG